jgi:hypothetical protein
MQACELAHRARQRSGGHLNECYHRHVTQLNTGKM